MRTKIIFLACLCALCVKATCESSDPPFTSEQILLHGILDFNADPNDVEAYVDNSAVYIYFNQSFGNVTVSLYNPNGALVYSGIVNTAVQQTLVIPVSFTIEGTYTVILENTFGYADGDFEKRFSI